MRWRVPGWQSALLVVLGVGSLFWGIATDSSVRRGLGVVLLIGFVITFEQWTYARGRTDERTLWERHYPDAEGDEWEDDEDVS